MQQIDNFVNSNAGNFECASEAEFLNELNMREVHVTECNYAADPMYVYMCEGNAVAWYDSELAYGYMPA